MRALHSRAWPPGGSGSLGGQGRLSQVPAGRACPPVPGHSAGARVTPPAAARPLALVTLPAALVLRPPVTPPAPVTPPVHGHSTGRGSSSGPGHSAGAPGAPLRPGHSAGPWVRPSGPVTPPAVAPGPSHPTGPRSLLQRSLRRPRLVLRALRASPVPHVVVQPQLHHLRVVDDERLQPGARRRRGRAGQEARLPRAQGRRQR